MTTNITKTTRPRFSLSIGAQRSDDARSVNIVASTSMRNDRGYRVDPAGWDLTRYRANPVVLLEHGAAAGLLGGTDPEALLPIGRAENVRVENGALRATIVFASAEANPVAERVRRLFAEGVLNAVSVGFAPEKVEVEKIGDEEIPIVRRAVLYEISVVAMPSDAGAVREAASATRAGLRALAAAPTTPTARKLEDHTNAELAALRESDPAAFAVLLDDYSLRRLSAEAPTSLRWRGKPFGALSVREASDLHAEDPALYRAMLAEWSASLNR